ncbi:TetR/AcrR family transcriptional regulator [Jatrophihabitans sp. YIM 134969]
MAVEVDDSGGVVDGRRERWVQHRANRRAALVAATIDAIDATASGSPTFDDVAAHAGVSRTVLYRYFADLDDLQQAAAAQLADDLIARVLGPLGEGRTARDIITSVLDGIAGWVEQHPRRYGFLRQFAAGAEVAAGVSGQLERVEDTVAARLAALLTLFMTTFGMPAHTAELGARALIGLVESSMVWWGRQPVETRQTRAEIVAAVSLYVWAAIDAELRENGVVLGLDDPLPEE